MAKKDCEEQIELIDDVPYEILARSFSLGNGTFTVRAGSEMNPIELAIGWATKFVLLQGFTHDTSSDWVSVSEPI